MPLPPELDDFCDHFEQWFQYFMRGQISVRVMNEDIERVYRHLPKHTPTKCRHGKTLLTCAECYVSNFRGDAV